MNIQIWFFGYIVPLILQTGFAWSVDTVIIFNWICLGTQCWFIFQELIQFMSRGPISYFGEWHNYVDLANECLYIFFWYYREPKQIVLIYDIFSLIENKSMTIKEYKDILNVSFLS